MKKCAFALLLLVALSLRAADSNPRACVGCHDGGKAPKISAVMAKWKAAVDPKLIARLQPLAPKGITLKGRHPNSVTSTSDIPDTCVKCHSATSRLAPPFAKMLHVLHWQAVSECTTCHKPNPETGLAAVPSGPEK
jgi:hypothetical protein